MTEEKIKPEETVEESAPAPGEELPPAEKETAPPEAEQAPEEAGPEAEAGPPAEEEPVEEEKKKKKIRHLSLEEVEKKLARARIKMGGEASVYVRHLKERKQELMGNDDQ